jgi:hypothetical protein
MNLRPYQQNALDDIRRHYAAGTKRVLLHLANVADENEEALLKTPR